MDITRLLYTSSHEWADVQGDVCTVGITQFAVEQLTDVTHLQLPKVGAVVAAGKPFGEIESVKAVFDLNAPLGGTVIDKNAALEADPGSINQDPYTKGWMIKLKLSPGWKTDHLMNLEAYEKQLADR